MVHENGWFLGIDVGTSSCKCAALDVHGEVLGISSSDYSFGNRTATWKEQAPRQLYAGVVQAVNKLLV